LIGALLFAFIPHIWEKINQKEEVKITQANLILPNDKPQSIEIPILDLKMEIKEASVSANNWEIYDNAVSWLKNSGDLKSGNMILYAHNDLSKFGKIIQLGQGSEIILKNQWQEKHYKVIDAFQTSNQDLWPIEAKENRLTMYTCSGLFDVNRFFVIAEPVEEN
ncbi:sortase, partial [Candidatus Beckwithbacteria bacterium]|nr:sortase [Candidatus Beckwithbacteria bacterium]